LPNNNETFKESQTRQSDPFDRLGLARRLHETLAQSLAIIGYDLDALIGDEELSPSHRAELRSIRMKVMSATKSFRDEIYRTRRFTREDLKSEIRALLSNIDTDINLAYPHLTEERENLLNQVLLEIARNTDKHSSARSFYVKYQLTPSGFILFVGDDGNGEVQLKERSFGLRGIDEVLKVISQDYQCKADETGTHFRITCKLENMN
jgi:signal transduction histidine kinase